MKKLLILLCLITCGFFCVVNQTNAQFSGYMGRRLIINYNAIGTLNPSGGNYWGHQGWSSLTVRHQVGAEYLLKRHLSIGLNYAFVQTGFGFTFENPNSYSGYYSYSTSTESYARINAHDINFQLVVTSRRKLLPVGPYFKLQLHCIIYDTKDVYDQFHLQGKSLAKGAVPGMSMETGFQRVLFQRWILRFGLQLGILLQGWNFNFGDGYGGVGQYKGANHEFSSYEYEYSDPFSAKTFNTYTRQRLWDNYFFNVNVGTGVFIY